MKAIIDAIGMACIFLFVTALQITPLVLAGLVIYWIVK